MAAKTNTGPGRAQRKGKSAEGRATVKSSPQSQGARVGRYKSPTESGRYTAPIPKNVKKSPRWHGVAILGLLIGGVLAIILNYLSVLPGSVSVWYLVGGLLGGIFPGFILATRYR